MEYSPRQQEVTRPRPLATRLAELAGVRVLVGERPDEQDLLKLGVRQGGQARGPPLHCGVQGLTRSY